MKNENGLEENLDLNLNVLNKIKGETLVNIETENINNLKQFILKFKDLNRAETMQTHDVYLKAHSINFLKQNSELDNVFTSVNLEDIMGKKLVEYEDWHIEDLADTGNLTGPEYNLTLTFEEGYSIEILNYQ